MRTTQRGADGASERAEDGIAESSPVRAGDAIEGPEQPTDERAMAGPPECSPPLPPAIPIPVVFVAPSSAWALGLLNPNAFPIPLKRHAQDLAHRLAAFRVACENVVRDVPQPSALVAKLRKISGPDFAPTDDKPIVAIYDAMTFVGSLYGMLVTMKTLLDVYAPMITDAVTPKERLKGFNSGKFEGAIGPGGKVLNWLLKQSQLRTVGGECASKLLEILRPEVAGWIATAIGWRDAAVHDGSLQFVQMQATVSRTIKTVEESEVVGPLMPDHTPVAEYARQLLAKVTSLLERSVRVLPGVDPSLLSPAGLDTRRG